MVLLAVLAFAVTVAAAARSTWSPCSLSMLSSMTPVAERSRGHRFAATASWFIVGSVAGGATLGGLAAALAGSVDALGPSAGARYAIVAVVAAAAALSDAGVGYRLPAHGRQVNEQWFDRFRPWVYASGFGWQIGAGLVTYITTAGVYVLVATAAMTGDPAVAFAVAVAFGALRGAAFLLATPLRDFGRVRRLLAGIERHADRSRLLTAAALAVVAAFATGLGGGPAVLAVAVAAAASIATGLRLRASAPA